MRYHKYILSSAVMKTYTKGQSSSIGQ